MPSYASLGFKSYTAYLKSDHWVEFRKNYLAEVGPVGCVVCGVAKVELHHKDYTNLGRETADDVVPLCRRHHEGLHVLTKGERPSRAATKRALTTLRAGKGPLSKAGGKRARKRARKEYQKEVTDLTYTLLYLFVRDATTARRAAEAVRTKSRTALQKLIAERRAALAQEAKV